ncbi:MAG: helix-turn-helix domain-containing protein [Planctomycetota bacterium]
MAKSIQFPAKKPKMATKTKPSKIHSSLVSHPLFILLDMDEGWRDQLGATRAIICNRAQDISDVLSKATTNSLWISSGSSMTDLLLRVMSRCSTESQVTRHRLGNLLMLESPRQKTIPFLRSLFENLVGEVPRFKLLPKDQLCEVLAGDSEAVRDLFVGGVIDTEFSLLMLVRGNFDPITVPLSVFRPSGTSKPDFHRFELDDYGHTVRFGEYEASSHFILYLADSDYRKRMNAKYRAQEKGFGPSLRRLRILKGILQDEFPGVNSKTIARIERGEVAKPHDTTRTIIAKTLGVGPDEIELY